MAAYIQYSFMFTLFVLILMQDERVNVKTEHSEFYQISYHNSTSKTLNSDYLPKAMSL